MTHYLLVSFALFAIGVYGVLARRHLLIMLMSVEVLLNGVNIALAAFSKYYGHHDGQIFVLMVMAVAAAEVSVGLAIVVAMFRNRESVDTDDLKSMKG